MTKKHMVFDLDDTLIDSYGFNQQMFVETFYSFVKKMAEGQKRYLRELHYVSRGQPMMDQFKRAAAYLKLDVDPQKLVAVNERLHHENISNVSLFAGIGDFIKAVKLTGKKVSICTNRQKLSLEKVLYKNGLSGVFSEVVSCADAGHEKPDPFCLLDLVNRSGLKKDEFVYFGDSETDVKFATSAGVDYVVVDHYLNNGKFFEVLIKSFL